MGYKQRTSDPFRPILYLPTAPITGVLLTVAVLCAGTWSMPPQAVLIDLPPPMPPGFPLLTHPSNTITLTASDEIRWNGVPVSVNGLLERLDATLTLPRQPVLLLDPESDTSYDLSARVLWLLKSRGFADEYFCFANLERYRHFEQPAPQPRSPLPADCHPELRMHD